MSNHFDKFEEIIKSKVDAFEAPFDISLWNGIESSLNAKAKRKMLWKSLIVASIVGVSLLSWWYLSASDVAPIAEVKPSQEQELVEEDSVKENTLSESTSEEIADMKNLSDIQDHKEEQYDLIEAPIASTQESEQLDQIADVQNEASTEQETKSQPQDEEEPPFFVNKTLPPPSANFRISDREICVGETIKFTPEASTVAASYLWDFGNGETSTDAHTDHVFNTSGRYKVTLVANSIVDDQQTSRVQYVDVYQKPRAEIIVESSFDLIGKPFTTFKINSHKKVKSLKWKLSNNEFSTDLEPNKMYSSKGRKTVFAQISDDNGCQVQVKKSFDIDYKYTLGAPLSFTPLLGETFMPPHLKQMNVNFTLTVHDRSTKEVVFTSTDVNQPWDGSINTGGQSSERRFVWSVEYIDPDTGKREIIKSTVTVN